MFVAFCNRFRDKVKLDSCKLGKFGAVVLTTNMNGKAAGNKAGASLVLAVFVMLQLVVKYF